MKRIARARRQPAPRRDARSVRDNLVYGRNAVLEAARAGRVIRVLMAERLEQDPRLAELRRLAPVEDVPAERVAALAQGAHQGVVAELRPRRYVSLRELLATEDDPHHFRSQLLHPGHGNLTALRVVSDTHDRGQATHGQVSGRWPQPPLL